MTKEQIQQLYIRVCRDSGFQLEYIQAAILTSRVIGCTALEIWLAFPSLGVMDEVARGLHPATKVVHEAK